MGLRGVGAAVAVVVLGVTAACTGDDGRATTSTPTTSSAPGPTETSTSEPPPPGPVTRQPVVIAANAHLPVTDIPRRDARAIIAGRADAWTTPGGTELTVYREPGPLAAVRASPDIIAVVAAGRLAPNVRALTVGGVNPLTQPASYPFKRRVPGEAPSVVTMTVVGDIMLGRSVGAATPDDPGSALDPLSHYLAAADITVGNLESTLSDDGRPTQDDAFHADPRVVTGLVDAGFDLLSLANNHTGDFGPRALRQTFDRLDTSPIERVGAGRDAREAWSPVVIACNGVRFGFLAFNAIGETPRATATRPGAAEIRMPPRTGAEISGADVRRMSSAIDRLSRRADTVIVLPHWGDQYTHAAVPAQRQVARALVDAGADLVLGGHPHWVQGLAMSRGGFIAYSLGNFVFDMDFPFPPQTREGVLLDLVFWDGDLMAVEPVPYVIGSDFAPRIAGGQRGQSILDDVWEHSAGVFRP